MAPACQLCDSVGVSLSKVIMASARLSERKLSSISRLDATHVISSLYATDASQATTLVLELKGGESE